MKKTLLCIFLIISLLLPVLSTPVFAASAPTLNIKKVSEIDYETAEVSATFKCSKKDCFLSYGVLYGTSESEMNERYVIKESSDTKYLSVSSTKSITLQNLQSNTAYFCCVYAVDVDGNTHTGKVTTFTTKAYVGKITATTGEAANIKYNSATVDLSYVEVDGCQISTKGFYYGTSTSMDNMKKVTLTGKTVAKTISNLTPETTYYYYAFVKAKDGRVFAGETRTFTTPPQFYGKIAVTTGEATKIEYKTATLNMSYETESPAKFDKCGFYYGTSVDAMKKVTCSKNTTTKDIKGLKGNTEYTWYAFAVAKDGREFIGEKKTFTTLDPQVISKIDLGSNSKTIYRYDSFIPYLEITPSSAAKNAQLIWTSSDENIIVKKGDRIKAVGNPGTATITASSPDCAVYDSITVTVREETDWGPGPVITSIKAVGEDQISLKWKRPSAFWPDEKLVYEVSRSTEYDGVYEIIQYLVDTYTTDDALEPDTTYYYKVQAYRKQKNVFEYTDFSDIVYASTNEHVYVPKKDKTESKEQESGVILPNTGSDSSNIIQPNLGTIPPAVSGLNDTYTIAKGDTLQLNFTVEDSADGTVEKVTVKHNAANSISSSISNETAGELECRFSISDKLFDNAGVYEFCVYARTTNFTVSNNLIGKFTVTVMDNACKHIQTTSAEKETVYTDLILTDAKHTSYTVYSESCNSCGADLGEYNGQTTTNTHSLIKNKGYCACGYIDVSGFTPRDSYNQTEKTQTVYRTPEDWNKYGSIYAGETVTVLGEWGNRYLIEYTLDGGGVKQGYVPKSIIPDEDDANSDMSKEDIYRQTLTKEQYDLWVKLKDISGRVIDNKTPVLLFESWADEYDTNLGENIRSALRSGFDGAQAVLNALTLDIKGAYDEFKSINNSVQRKICYKEAIKQYMSKDIDSSIKPNIEETVAFLGSNIGEALETIEEVDQVYKDCNNISEDAEIIANIAKSMNFKNFNVKSKDLYQRLSAVSVNIDGKKYNLKDYVNLKDDNAVEIRSLLMSVKDSDDPVKTAKDLEKISIVKAGSKIAKYTGTFISSVNVVIELEVMMKALDRYADDLASSMNVADPLFIECIDEVVEEYTQHYTAKLIAEEALILGSYLLDEANVDEALIKWMKNKFPKYASEIQDGMNLVAILNLATSIIEGSRDFFVNTNQISNSLDSLPHLRDSISSARTTCISTICNFIYDPTPNRYQEIITAVSYYELIGMIGTEVLVNIEKDEFDSIMNKIFHYNDMDEAKRAQLWDEEMEKLNYFRDLIS